MNNSSNNKYEVVNENDEVIGLEDKETILEKGLLRRVIHIWFFTPNGEVIFQHRSPDKDIFPDVLDYAVGGKVEAGATYLDTAIAEALEETGVAVSAEELIPIEKFRFDFVDGKSGFRNNIFAMQYAYCYRGKLEDLVPEAGKILRFEAWPIDKLLNLTKEEEKKFIKEALESREFKKALEVIKGLIN